MSTSIKLSNNTYLDSTGIAHNKQLLSTLLTDMIVIKKVSKTASTSAESFSLNASVPDGYKFLSWVGISSNGFYGTAYINPYNSSNASMYVVKNGAGSWDIYYLCIRDI